MIDPEKPQINHSLASTWGRHHETFKPLFITVASIMICLLKYYWLISTIVAYHCSLFPKSRNSLFIGWSTKTLANVCLLLKHNLRWLSITNHHERIETLTSVLFIRYPYSSILIRCPICLLLVTPAKLSFIDHDPPPPALIAQCFLVSTLLSPQPLSAITGHCDALFDHYQTLLDKQCLIWSIIH